MGLVHAFVAEVFRKFVNSVVASDYEPLEVQLIGYTHVKVYIKGVVVGDERTGCGSTRNALENRSFHLQTAGFVEILPHCGNDLGPFDEGLLYLRIYDKVHIALAVTELRVAESVKYLSVLFLHYREHSQRFAEHSDFFGMD